MGLELNEGNKDIIARYEEVRGTSNPLRVVSEKIYVDDVGMILDSVGSPLNEGWYDMGAVRSASHLTQENPPSQANGLYPRGNGDVYKLSTGIPGTNTGLGKIFSRVSLPNQIKYDWTQADKDKWIVELDATQGINLPGYKVYYTVEKVEENSYTVTFEAFFTQPTRWLDKISGLPSRIFGPIIEKSLNNLRLSLQQTEQ